MEITILRSASSVGIGPHFLWPTESRVILDLHEYFGYACVQGSPLELSLGNWDRVPCSLGDRIPILLLGLVSFERVDEVLAKSIIRVTNFDFSGS